LRPTAQTEHQRFDGAIGRAAAQRVYFVPMRIKRHIEQPPELADLFANFRLAFGSHGDRSGVVSHRCTSCLPLKVGGHRYLCFFHQFIELRLDASDENTFWYIVTPAYNSTNFRRQRNGERVA
jgi:hypothetical protein